MRSQYVCNSDTAYYNVRAIEAVLLFDTKETSYTNRQLCLYDLLLPLHKPVFVQ